MAANTSTRNQSSKICEDLLDTERRDLIEKAIYPSRVVVIDRLLGRSLELADAYEELHSKLASHPQALKVFFDLLQDIAAFSTPAASREARKDKALLSEVNRKIERAATALAALLEERKVLDNQSDFSCDTLYHPVDVIHLAAARNYSYEHWVKERLEAVRTQFDLKYWPSLSEMAQVIADDAAKADPVPHDAVTEAATEGRSGLSDTFKAFFVALEEATTRHHGFLPDNFELTDKTVAILLSCALGLDSEEVCDAQFVKGVRQRQRKRLRQAD